MLPKIAWPGLALPVLPCLAVPGIIVLPCLALPGIIFLPGNALPGIHLPEVVWYCLA